MRARGDTNRGLDTRGDDSLSRHGMQGSTRPTNRHCRRDRKNRAKPLNQRPDSHCSALNARQLAQQAGLQLPGEKEHCPDGWGQVKKNNRPASTKTQAGWLGSLPAESRLAVSSRWATVMLIGQQHLVQIGRDGDFVIGEVAKPGSVALNCVGEQRKNLFQWHGYAVVILCRSVEHRRTCVRFWSVVNPQSSVIHPCPSLLSLPNGEADKPRGRSIARLSASCGSALLLRPPCLLHSYRLTTCCRFDPIQRNCQIFPPQRWKWLAVRRSRHSAASATGERVANRQGCARTASLRDRSHRLSLCGTVRPMNFFCESLSFPRRNLHIASRGCCAGTRRPGTTR